LLIKLIDDIWITITPYKPPTSEPRNIYILEGAMNVSFLSRNVLVVHQMRQIQRFTSYEC